jgi:hypothetical protein
MIRFIDLSGQIDEDIRFAFFNTVTDRFMEIGDEYTWFTLESFLQSYAYYVQDLKRSCQDPIKLDRFTSLIPENFFNGNECREPKKDPNWTVSLRASDFTAPLTEIIGDVLVPVKTFVDPASPDEDMTGTAVYRDGKLVYFSVSNIKPSKR